MSKAYKSKKIFLNTAKTNYCIVRVYADKKEMQEDYKKHPCHNIDDKEDRVLGAHLGYVRLNIDKEENEEVSKETGTIFLCFAHCGAGVAGHELLHGIFWGWKFHKDKEQYPIVINNMEEEEELLHNYSYAVIQFYKWYWKIEKYFKKC